jgi:hypothetical protein
MEWLVGLALIVGMILLLSHEQKRRASRTEEEYQRDVEEAGKSLTSVALLELQKNLRPDARPGIEYVMDEKKGMTGEKCETGDDSGTKEGE